MHKEEKIKLRKRYRDCLICGTRRQLTLHHIIPKCYRNPLHHEYRYHDKYDTIIVCERCHEIYEKHHALLLKCKLRDKFDAPFEGVGLIFADNHEPKKAAYALISNFDSIPKGRIIELKNIVSSYLGIQPDRSDMIKLCKEKSQTLHGPNYCSHGELVIAKIDDIQKFWEMWRFHFVEKMQPRFLPRTWDPTRRVRWFSEYCKQRRSTNCPCGGP